MSLWFPHDSSIKGGTNDPDESILKAKEELANLHLRRTSTEFPSLETR